MFEVELEPPKVILKNGQFESASKETFLAMKKSCCTLDKDMAALLARQMVDILPKYAVKDEGFFNGVLAALNSIAPRNELEAMLSVQMVAVHLMSMEASSRVQGGQGGMVENVNLAIKL